LGKDSGPKDIPLNGAPALSSHAGCPKDREREAPGVC